MKHERATEQREPGRGAVRAWLRWMSATQVAVVLILALVSVLAGATIYEGIAGRTAARCHVYHSWWFVALFALLAVNVAAGLLVRWPWRRHLCWFVLIHLGLLVLLLGLLRSLLGSVDGQVALQVGVPRAEIALVDRSELRVRRRAGGRQQLTICRFFDLPQALTANAFAAAMPDSALNLRVLEFRPATPADTPVSASSPMSAAGEAAALIELREGEHRRRIWLEQDGAERTVGIDDKQLSLRLVRQLQPIGFSVELLEFQRTTNPGGAGDAWLAARVRFGDDDVAGESREAVVSVNRPASHRGFKFTYQSDRTLDGDSTEVTLGVTSDPGRLLKYLGVTTICLGMVLAMVLPGGTAREVAA